LIIFYVKLIPLILHPANLTISNKSNIKL
jgi:hypothetical protein